MVCTSVPEQLSFSALIKSRVCHLFDLSMPLYVHGLPSGLELDRVKSLTIILPHGLVRPSPLVQFEREKLVVSDSQEVTGSTHSLQRLKGVLHFCMKK